MKIATLILCLLVVAAGPATQPSTQQSYTPQKLKKETPGDVALAFADSEIKKSEIRESVAKVVAESNARLDCARNGTIGGTKRVEKRIEKTGKWFYSFPTKKDKDSFIEEVEAGIKQLEEKSAIAANPKAFLPDQLRLSVGSIGRLRNVRGKTISVMNGKAVVMIGGKSDQMAMVYGELTKQLVDGKWFDFPENSWRITGTETYTTVLGAGKAVLKIEPFYMSDWYTN